MKKYFFIAIPTILFFASPWIHYIGYHNLLLAIPDLPQDTAHGAVVIGAVVACIITFLIANAP